VNCDTDRIVWILKGGTSSKKHHELIMFSTSNMSNDLPIQAYWPMVCLYLVKGCWKQVFRQFRPCFQVTLL
jgi:hypothetical protein